MGTGAAAAASRAAAGAGRGYRNVLLLISDDHSPIAGCYGDPVVRTPNLDRLAREGVRFPHAFCTTPSCSASRSVILTGLHNHRNGQFGHAHLPANLHTHPSVHSIPMLLRRHGFAAGVIGKLHVQPESVYPWDYAAESGCDLNPRNVWEVASRVREFLDRFPDQPFYLHVGFTDPHRYGDPSLFANSRDWPNVEARRYSPDEVVVPPFLPDTPETRKELAEYYQSIDRLDQGIGFCLDALEESGRAEDTLVIYMSDHGMPFPGAKGSLYDSGLRIPLIVRRPDGSRPGLVNQAMASCVDILPTVIDWANAELPPYPVHGRSLLPVLEEENPEGWDELFFSHTFHEIVNYFPFRGVRTRKWKYQRILFPELEMPLPSDLWNSPTWQGLRSRGLKKMGERSTRDVLNHPGEELFDMEADPVESRNLAGLPRYRDVVRDLSRRVDEFRKETEDPWFDYFQRIQKPPENV